MQAEAEVSNSNVQEIAKKFQYLLDKASPHILYRWIAFGISLSLYFWRVYLIGAFFIVTYGKQCHYYTLLGQ